MPNKKLNNYRLLKNEARKLGASLFGVADISSEKKNFDLPEKSTQGFDSAISIGVTLSEAIFDTLESAPNNIYFHHYRTANVFLDQLSFKLSNIIQNAGFRALPVAASQIVDWQKQTAHLSHKKIGVLAGLGWIGRNNLLVNEKFGCRLRLATILTDMPLKIDKATLDNCGSCRMCIKACPVTAIKLQAQDFDHKKCFEQLKQFQKSGVVGQYICGLCVKVCPGKAAVSKK